MDSPARVPVEIELAAGMSVTGAAERLRQAIEDRPSVEDGTDRARDRRLIGVVVGPTVDLAVRDERLWTRRKGFQVEFHGALEGTPAGAVLRGTIDIPEHRQLGVFLRLFAAIGALIVPMAIAIEVRDLASGSPFAFEPVALALGIAAITVLGTIRLAADIEHAAADDARLVAAFLGRFLAESGSTFSAAQSRDIAER